MTTAYRDVENTLEDNENLSNVEKQLVLAKQTWAKDKSYSGLETDLNLTYYEDKTGQRYQRTPEEQKVIIKGLNDYWKNQFLPSKYSPEEYSRNLGLVLETPPYKKDYVNVEQKTYAGNKSSSSKIYGQRHSRTRI